MSKKPMTEKELLDLADKKLDEMEAKDKKTQVDADNLFRRADIIGGASRDYRVEVPELNAYFTFRKLTWDEARELNKIKDVEEKSLKTIAKMIEKANPDLDIEAILSKIPVDVMGLISVRIQEISTVFLQTKT